MNWMVLLRRIGATALFMIGVIGLLLPIVPGWIFIGVGLYILSIDSPGIEGRINALRTKYRHINNAMHGVENRFGKRPKIAHDDISLPRNDV